ncbi:MAG: homocysteine S-methyltransferase family protein [Oscillospiraceae bacterium]|nr:homocysteine S-methyltransferase family protein [Oscillospiraceae bacterium]
MIDIGALIKENLLFFDGAMGTMLQQRGLNPGELPELLNVTHPEIVTDIHREYVLAGADIITANTFQANAFKLKDTLDVETAVSAAIKCAKGSGARFVALDAGPLGQFMEPMGDISFERAYEAYKRQMIAGEKAGADLVIIETVADLYEAKAAILAAKENTALPVICSMTFQADGRTFTGCDAITAAVALSGLQVSALGVNCSVGPDAMMPVVDTLLRYSKVPVIVQANAGLPVVRGDKTEYEVMPEQYAAKITEMVSRGVKIVGGCCGTTPQYIKTMKERMSGIKPVDTGFVPVTACSSGRSAVIFDGKIAVIGQRLNPAGNEDMQKSLRDGEMEDLIDEAMDQLDDGAHVLDLNVALPDTDEPALLREAVRVLQGAVASPLSLDSADPAAIEAALRVYNGKAVVNSANGKKDVMDTLFPLVKKYGAVVVCLTLDENGIPETAEKRLQVAGKIRDTALYYGIGEEDLLIDCLALTASAQQNQAKETLEAIRMVKSELGLKTVLGISNISFGMPERDALNAAFLAAAVAAGLDAAILDPAQKRCREALLACRVLTGEDKAASGYIEEHGR